jgi:hypothetical protein
MSSVKTGKKDRTGGMIVALLVSVVLSGYGFREHDPLFAWMLPLGIMGVAAAWTFWPRSGERVPAGRDA